MKTYPRTTKTLKKYGLSTARSNELVGDAGGNKEQKKSHAMTVIRLARERVAKFNLDRENPLNRLGGKPPRPTRKGIGSY